MKKLFKDGDIKEVYAYESEAMEIKHETTEALQPIIDKWVDNDYSPHEITAIMVNVITSLMSRKIVYDVRKGRKPTIRLRHRSLSVLIRSTNVSFPVRACVDTATKTTI